MSDSKPIRIKKVEIRFDLKANIVLEPIAEGPLTILHGINGCGKTTLFRMLAALHELDIATLKAIQYQQFQVQYDNGVEVEIRRDFIDPDEIRRYMEVHGIAWAEAVSALRRVNRDGMTVTFPGHNAINHPLDKIEAHVDEASLDFDLYSEKNGKHCYLGMEFSSIVDMTRHLHTPERFGAIELAGRDRELIREMSKLPAIRLISADRLHENQEKTRYGHMAADLSSNVERCATLLREEWRKIADVYKREAGGLAASFLKRAIELSRQKWRLWNMKKCAENLREINEMRNRYMWLFVTHLGEVVENERMPWGTVDAIEVPQEADAGLLAMIQTHVEDQQQLYSEIERRSQRISLFRKQLANRFNKKRLKVMADGIAVYSDNDRRIPLDRLSSGERHSVVLFCRLILEPDAGDVILIDEPELSFHINWQRQFIDEVLEILQITGATGIVATHSPNIVGEHFDSLIRLDE